MRSLLPLFVLPIAIAAPAMASESVSVPTFRSIQLRGGGEVTVRPGPVQRVTIIEGSAAVTRFRVERGDQLRIDVCDRNCPRHYRLRIDIQSPSAPNLGIDGGGLIRAAGGFGPQRQLSAAIRGGGKIDALAVPASDVSAAVHGGGLISVRARSSLTAAVNGGGEIRYSGSPRITSAINGGGAVHRIN